MEKCFLYKNDGYYSGEGMAYRRLPGNATFTPPPPGPWLKVWPRFVDGGWVMAEDHRERSVQLFGDNAQEATLFWLPEDDWQSPPRKMTQPGPFPEGALLAPPQKPELSLPEARAQALEKVDSATSAAILAGFEYEVDGRQLHFSYDSFDQQNFADSANVATRVISGNFPGLPRTVTWNAYDDGELVRLEFGPADFLALYTQGALGHKAACMEMGGQRKAALVNVATAAEIGALLAEWGI